MGNSMKDKSDDILYRNSIMVFAETTKGGKLTKQGLEVVGASELLSSYTDMSIDVFIAGVDNSDAVKTISSYNANRVISVEGNMLKPENISAYVRTMATVVRKYKPSVLLIPMSLCGREIAARTAAVLDLPVVADCTDFRISAETGRITWARMSFGGYISSEIEFRECTTQIVCLRQGIFDMPVTASVKPEIIRETDCSFKGEMREVFVRSIAHAVQGIYAVEDADVIVAGGRGAGGAKGFALIRELAETLGGAIGASRVAVDNGWAPHSALIGQSGKTVAPALYISCGIAGSVQHITGMRDSGCVVSINTDPRALIFDVSDYGIVGDMFTVLPILTNEIRKIKAK